LLKLFQAAVLALVFLFGSHMGQAQAQVQGQGQVDITRFKDLPTFLNEMSVADFLSKSQETEEKPKGDRYLGFKIRLPKDWTRVGERIDDVDADSQTVNNVKLSRRLLGKVVKYYGIADLAAPSRVDVQALDLQHQITAKNWFLGYALSNGYTLQGMKVVSDDRVEALYVLIEDSTSYVVRTLAIINGPRIVLVSYYVPEAVWTKERAMQEYVLDTFRFTDPEKTQIDVTRTYSYLDLLKFDYPASWRLIAPNISSTQGFDARLINAHNDHGDKRLLGEINMRIVSTEMETSLPQEVNYLKEAIGTMGLQVGDLIETPTNFKFKPQVTFARVEVYNAKSKDNKVEDYEYWLAVMGEDRYYYIITMITPSRSADFYNWAQNTEAYQTVIESMRQ
jgi:hypothetical protein